MRLSKLLVKAGIDRLDALCFLDFLQHARYTGEMRQVRRKVP